LTKVNASINYVLLKIIAMFKHKIGRTKPPEDFFK